MEVVALVDDITTIQEYSKFMIKELVKYVDTDFVLCTQWDAYILNPDAWDEAFLQYDYIGAPWWFQDGDIVGNGGFSLRSKRFLQVCSKLPLRNFHPEDLVLCRTYSNLLKSKGIRFAPESLATKFSREGNQKYGHRWQSELGFHDYEMTDISAWKGYDDLVKDPELKKIQFKEKYKGRF